MGSLQLVVVQGNEPAVLAKVAQYILDVVLMMTAELNMAGEPKVVKHPTKAELPMLLKDVKRVTKLVDPLVELMRSTEESIENPSKLAKAELYLAELAKVSLNIAGMVAVMEDPVSQVRRAMDSVELGKVLENSSVLSTRFGLDSAELSEIMQQLAPVPHDLTVLERLPEGPEGRTNVTQGPNELPNVEADLVTVGLLDVSKVVEHASELEMSESGVVGLVMDAPGLAELARSVEDSAELAKFSKNSVPLVTIWQQVVLIVINQLHILR
ncbi:hypothetical protein PHYPSEUDO_007910 [Phytophthora pseudosyringae]|uniref:Uncharacterized protein n=1 Tax=Phytophthora pseudosyringae TaxID=221518 RepID=A0A8T1VG95_9STRA|nr:hypothetical protein PHYPSEUDO_007910 [Phytophthora pseudosyringae]